MSPERSTPVDTAVTGTTSSVSCTVVGTVAVDAPPGQPVFSAGPGTRERGAPGYEAQVKHSCRPPS